MIQFLMVLVALSPVVFLIGLLKPGWILFWVKKPDRLWASSVGLVLFMVAFTGYSEARLKHKAAGQDDHPREQLSPDRQNELQLNRTNY